MDWDLAQQFADAEAQREIWGLLHALRWADAAAAARQALRVDPTMPITYGYLGYALMQLGRLQEARRHYERSVALDSSDAWVWHVYGDLEFRERHSEAAAEAYRRSLRLDPNNATVLWKLADHVEDLTERRRLLEAAQALAPDNARVLCAMGQLACQEGKFEDAIQFGRSAIAREPTLSIAHHGVGMALALLGRWDEALAEARAALALRPNDPDFQKLARVIEGNLEASASDGGRN